MEQILKKILSENGYEPRTQGIEYHSKGDSSFFFLTSLPELTFKLIKNHDSFDTNEQFKAIMDGFKNIINSGDQIAIEKNSSLIVLVKCASITSLSDLQQQILFLEEDEFFLKKYVILYTDASISALTDDPIVNSLVLKINSIENFGYFATNGYSEEIAEYLVIMQLFIKLPFLKLTLDLTGYSTLSQKLESVLGGLSGLHQTLLERADEFALLDFTNSDDEEKINELIELLPNDQN